MPCIRVLHCRLSLYLNVGELQEGPGKRFDSPGKLWIFLSKKVWVSTFLCYRLFCYGEIHVMADWKCVVCNSVSQFLVIHNFVQVNVQKISNYKV